MAPLRLRRGQGAMQGNPCYARLFADLPYTPRGPSLVPSGQFTLCRQIRSKPPWGQSRAPPVAGGARRKPSEQGSARKAPRADAARPLRTACRTPGPRGFSTGWLVCEAEPAKGEHGPQTPPPCPGVGSKPVRVHKSNPSVRANSSTGGCPGALSRRLRRR